MTFMEILLKILVVILVGLCVGYIGGTIYAAVVQHKRNKDK